MTTFAPAAMQAWPAPSASGGSLRAFVIDALTPAALNAEAMAGLSNCTQRTDDFVSGSRTQTSTLAVFCFVAAVALATMNTAKLTVATATSASAVGLRKTFFTCDSFYLRGTGGRTDQGVTDASRPSHRYTLLPSNVLRKRPPSQVGSRRTSLPRSFACRLAVADRGQHVAALEHRRGALLKPLPVRNVPAEGVGEADDHAEERADGRRVAQRLLRDAGGPRRLGVRLRQLVRAEGRAAR